MDPRMEEQARKLADNLKKTGPDCGLLIEKGTVILRCPGTPFRDTLTPYSQNDLKNAVALGLVEKKPMTLMGSTTGSSGWDWYVVKQHPAK